MTLAATCRKHSDSLNYLPTELQVRPAADFHTHRPRRAALMIGADADAAAVNACRTAIPSTATHSGILRITYTAAAATRLRLNPPIA
jgi:hypothetical protein